MDSFSGTIYPEGVAFKSYELTDEDFVGPNCLACHQRRADIIAAQRCPPLTTLQRREHDRGRYIIAHSHCLRVRERDYLISAGPSAIFICVRLPWRQRMASATGDRCDCSILAAPGLAPGD
jgi:hypothetical protein